MDKTWVGPKQTSSQRYSIEEEDTWNDFTKFIDDGLPQWDVLRLRTFLLSVFHPQSTSLRPFTSQYILLCVSGDIPSFASTNTFTFLVMGNGGRNKGVAQFR